MPANHCPHLRIGLDYAVTHYLLRVYAPEEGQFWLFVFVFKNSLTV